MTMVGTAQLPIGGYYPGAVGQITWLHAIYYFEHWGFNVSFETQVGREFSTFVAAMRPGRDGLWVAADMGQLAGSIAIDGSAAPPLEGARLRWFIVAPGLQGQGLGRRLLRQAVAFCDAAGFAQVFLWTFRGLDAARHLYEAEGFRLEEEHRVAQWGTTIMEQRFVRCRDAETSRPPGGKGGGDRA